MIKLVMMPPQSEQSLQWANRLRAELPQYHITLPETDEDAHNDLVDADAVFGWVPPDMLAGAQKLRWLQSPQAGPKLDSTTRSWSNIRWSSATHGVFTMIILASIS